MPAFRKLESASAAQLSFLAAELDGGSGAPPAKGQRPRTEASIRISCATAFEGRATDPPPRLAPRSLRQVAAAVSRSSARVPDARWSFDGTPPLRRLARLR